uniref:Major facilitator superfamily (MFS) profile domain-containing protein n=1 Tax=Brassica oleracea var. oleracea TaxID=109376 RepID=A0A0D3CI11_BRAOL
MGEEPLLQKLRIQEDIESAKHKLVNDDVDDGDGPVTFILLFTTFTALCGTFSYGTAAGFTSPAQSGMMAGLNLSLAEFSFFGSILTIGGLVGAALSGKLADLLGRRGALWVSNSFCMTGWLMIAYSQAAWSLDIGRLFLGVAAGLSCYVVPVYIVEISPKQIRGAFTAVNAVVNIRPILVMSSSVSITFLVGSATSWKTLALISTVPCVLEFVGLFFIPESPRWLSRNGRVKESVAALQRLRGNNTNITKEAAEIKIYMENLQEEFKEDCFFELFKPRYSRVISVGIGLLVLQQVGGLSGYTFYMSSIFHKSVNCLTGFPNNIGVSITSAVQLVTSILGLIIVDKYGRRSLLTVIPYFHRNRRYSMGHGLRDDTDKCKGIGRNAMQSNELVLQLVRLLHIQLSLPMEYFWCVFHIFNNLWFGHSICAENGTRDSRSFTRRNPS